MSPFWKRKEDSIAVGRRVAIASGRMTGDEYDELMDLHYRYGSRTIGEQRRYFELQAVLDDIYREYNLRTA